MTYPRGPKVRDITAVPTRQLAVLTCGALLIVLCWRALALAQPFALLQYDEIYYYHWSLVPDWGYYSKPPAIAWLIGATTALLGHGFWGIKVGALLAWFATGLVVGRIAARHWGPRAGATAALLCYSAPLAGFYSLFMTTDALLLLAWSSALGLYLEARASDTVGAWLLAGLAVGVGMLCKYNMSLLALAFVLDALATADGRRLLARPGPWLGGLLALVVFAPNVLWNVAHDFIAWRHTGEISRFGGGEVGPDLLGLLGFLATQIGLFGPLTCLALLAGAPRLARAATADPALRLTLIAGACSLGTILAMALLTRAFANWAAPTLISVALLAGWLLRERSGIVVASASLNLTLLGLLMHWPLLLHVAGVASDRSIDPWTRHGGWDRAAATLADCIELTGTDIADVRLASDSRELLAQMQFRLRPGDGDIAFWQPDPDHFENWYDQRANLRTFRDHPAQSFLLLARHLEPAEIGSAFSTARRLCRLEDPRNQGTDERIEVQLVRGFRGYPGADPA